MGRICEICSNENRNDIDKELLDGRTMASVSRKYGVSESSLCFHKNHNHISKRLEKSYALRQQDENFDLLNRIEKIIKDAEIIFKRNFDKHKDRIALKALDSQRATFDLLAKISYAHHQAKLIELEILQQSNNDRNNEVAENTAKAFVDSLEILSDDEMTVWEKLYNKILSQDISIDALQSIKIKYGNKSIEQPKQEIIKKDFIQEQEIKKDLPKEKKIEQPKKIRPIIANEISFTEKSQYI